VDLTVASISAQKQEFVQNTIGIGVLRKSLDIQAEQGAEIVKMMDQAGGVGQRVDLHA
jgi:hypothetical protein